MYKDIFYVYYAWAKRRESDTTPIASAIFGVAFIIFINICNVLVILGELSNIKVFLMIPDASLIPIVIIYFLIHVIVLTWQKRYKTIIEGYEKKYSHTDLRKKGKKVLYYTIGTIVIFLLTLIVGAVMKQ